MRLLWKLSSKANPDLLSEEGRPKLARARIAKQKQVSRRLFLTSKLLVRIEYDRFAYLFLRGCVSSSPVVIEAVH